MCLISLHCSIGLMEVTGTKTGVSTGIKNKALGDDY